MSAIADTNEGPNEVLKVLFALYPGYNTLDVAGPLEILSRSLHEPKDKCKSICLDLMPTSLKSHVSLLSIRPFVDTPPQRPKPSNASSSAPPPQ